MLTRGEPLDGDRGFVSHCSNCANTAGDRFICCKPQRGAGARLAVTCRIAADRNAQSDAL
jgi:hypothetical protein